MTASVTRREALILGGTGTVAIAAGAAGLATSTGFGPTPGRTGEAFTEPRTYHSTSGLLEVSLTASRVRRQVAGRQADVFGYNAGLPGPTFRLRPGDRFRVAFRNDLDEPTNLHVHGLHVSPEGAGDNMFVTVLPGHTHQYDYQLPATHPPGVFWYHPHHHGMVAQQVFGGLYGAIIVEDIHPIPVTRERVLVISDITLDSSGGIPPESMSERMMGREGALVLVNGQSVPELSIQPGARERWRVVNACASRYLDLSLDGQNLLLLGKDSGRFTTPTPVDRVALAPGNRADLLVTGARGRAVFRAHPVDRGAASMMGSTGNQPASTAIDLATLRMTGARALAPAPVPMQPRQRDVSAVTVAAKRQFTFAMGMGGSSGMGMSGSMMSFTINGDTFDPGRVNTTAQSGTVEEWTLHNTSPMDHPVHLHVWPMQVTDSNGSPHTQITWQDVVNVPARGQVTVRVPFDDFAGKTVYHCHILDHEDAGMMGVINVR
jgi:FtsP/CotA-like multicopper oxidase with cupredoxin domain